MTQTPNLALDYLLPNQAQKHVTVNENMRRLDALVQLSVQSASVAAEPATPADGQGYILPAGASGAVWSGFGAGDVAVFQDGGWTRLIPSNGWGAEVLDIGERLVFRAGAWSRPAQLGLNAASDTSNRLAVGSPGVLFTHEGAAGSMRLKVNKSGTGETASQLFQTGFSGRAELGLMGDDKFRIKASADGAAWTDALVVAPASGFAGFGISDPQHRLDVGGAICIRRPAGQFHITNDGADTSLAAGASVNIQNFSGLLLVSNTTTGSTGLYLCGGGNAALINSVTGVAGALSFASGPFRYVFTNTSGSTANFRFLLLRSRDVA